MSIASIQGFQKSGSPSVPVDTNRSFTKTVPTQRLFLKIHNWPAHIPFKKADRMFAQLTDSVKEANMSELKKLIYEFCEEIESISLQVEPKSDWDAEVKVGELKKKLDAIEKLSPSDVSPVLLKALQFMDRGKQKKTPMQWTVWDYCYDRWSKLSSDPAAQKKAAKKPSAPFKGSNRCSFSTVLKTVTAALFLWELRSPLSAAYSTACAVGTLACHPLLTARAMAYSTFSETDMKCMVQDEHLLSSLNTIGVCLNKPCSDCENPKETLLTRIVQIEREEESAGSDEAIEALLKLRIWTPEDYSELANHLLDTGREGLFSKAIEKNWLSGDDIDIGQLYSKYKSGPAKRELVRKLAQSIQDPIQQLDKNFAGALEAFEKLGCYKLLAQAGHYKIFAEECNSKKILPFEWAFEVATNLSLLNYLMNRVELTKLVMEGPPSDPNPISLLRFIALLPNPKWEMINHAMTSLGMRWAPDQKYEMIQCLIENKQFALLERLRKSWFVDGGEILDHYVQKGLSADPDLPDEQNKYFSVRETLQLHGFLKS